jgi:hypothetical protein
VIRIKCAEQNNLTRNHFQLFRVIFLSSHRHILGILGILFTVEWGRQTCLWWRSKHPHPSSSWSSPGTGRGCPAPSSLSGTENSPLGWDLVNKEGGRWSWHVRFHVNSLTDAAGADWSIVLVPKPVLGQQSGIFWLENHLGLSQSLFGLGCVDGFTAGLSKQWQEWQPWRGHSFSSFGYFFIYNSNDEGNYFNYVMYPYALYTNDFTSHKLFAALTSMATKFTHCTSVIAWTGWGSSL